MVLLLLVSLLLAATPVIVAVLFLWVGLTTQADLLLARIDSVLRYSDDLARRRPFLVAHVWEVFNYVKWYASDSKIQQLYKSTETEGDKGDAEKGAAPDAAAHSGPNANTTLKPPNLKKAHDYYGERLNDKWKWKGIKIFLLNCAKYVFPAILLLLLYFAGALVVLLLSCNNPPPATNGFIWWLQWQTKLYVTSLTCCGYPVFDYLAYAFLGGFLFNTGIMVRRICMWDITGQMYWWALYRLLLSLGLAQVVHAEAKTVDPAWYLLIATFSVSLLDSLIRSLRSKLLQSDSTPKQNDLSLQLIQGIDYWKEQRLAEEGIESIEHLATSDFILLALRTRSNLHTVMDWVDQAIFIQRFPGRLDRLKDTGLPASAVELTWLYTHPQPDAATLSQAAQALGIDPLVIAQTLHTWTNDSQVQQMTMFWRADLGAPVPTA